MAARDLCALSDVTALVPGYTSDTATNTALSALITEVSRDIMERSHREFTAIETTQPATRLFDVNQTTYMYRRMRVGDFTTLSAVTVLDQNSNTIATVDITSSSIVKEPRVREDWEPYGTLWFRSDVTSPVPLVPGYVVQISATWGFPSVPTTIKQACAKLVLWRYLTDTTAAGTQIANLLEQAEFSLAGAFRSANQTIERFYVPDIGSSGDYAPQNWVIDPVAGGWLN